MGLKINYLGKLCVTVVVGSLGGGWLSQGADVSPWEVGCLEDEIVSLEEGCLGKRTML